MLGEFFWDWKKISNLSDATAYELNLFLKIRLNPKSALQNVSGSRVRLKSQHADPEIEFLTESIFKVHADSVRVNNCVNSLALFLETKFDFDQNV